MYIHEIYKRNQFRNSKRKLLCETQQLHRPKLFAESPSPLRSGYACACNSISGQHKAPRHVFPVRRLWFIRSGLCIRSETMRSRRSSSPVNSRRLFNCFPRPGARTSDNLSLSSLVSKREMLLETQLESRNPMANRADSKAKCE